MNNNNPSHLPNPAAQLNKRETNLPAGGSGDAPFLVPDTRADHGITGSEQLTSDLWEYTQQGENICLVVMPKTGKAAVALELSRNQGRALQHFEGVLWANLGRQFVMLEELEKWADALQLMNRDELVTEEDWKNAIKTKIGQRRLLVILEDVHHTKRALEFKVLGPNCVYVIMTRHRDVAAELLGQAAVTVVKELDEVVGLELLKDIAPKAVEFDPGAARALVAIIQKQPLALSLAGKYLKKMSSQEDPERIRAAFRTVREAVELLKLKPADKELSLEDIVDASYSALESEESRRVFLALSIFRSKPNTFSEEIAGQVCGADVDSIYDLSDIGLIEHYGRDSYTMHPVIAEYARQKLDRLDPEAAAKLHSKAVDYYEQRLSTDIDKHSGVSMEDYVLEQGTWQAMEDALRYHLAHTAVRASTTDQAIKEDAAS